MLRGKTSISVPTFWRRGFLHADKAFPMDSISDSKGIALLLCQRTKQQSERFPKAAPRYIISGSQRYFTQQRVAAIKRSRTDRLPFFDRCFHIFGQPDHRLKGFPFRSSDRTERTGFRLHSTADAVMYPQRLYEFRRKIRCCDIITGKAVCQQIFCDPEPFVRIRRAQHDRDHAHMIPFRRRAECIAGCIAMTCFQSQQTGIAAGELVLGYQFRCAVPQEIPPLRIRI